MLAKPTFKTPYMADAECEKCSGMGFVPEPERCGSMAMCECNARMGHGHRVAVSRIPVKYKTVTGDSFKPETANERAALKDVGVYVRTFRQHENDLYLFGQYGTGKTHLACAVLMALTKHHAVGILYWPVAQLLAEAKKAFDTRGDVEVDKNLFDKICDIDVLALDDLGADRPTDWAIEYLTSLVDSRYSSNKPTIITSNIHQKDLYNVYGGRLASRVFERCVVGHLDGRDRRQAVAA